MLDADRRTETESHRRRANLGSEIQTAARIPSAGSLLDTEARATPSDTAKPKRRTRSRILLGAALAAVLLTVVGVVVYAMQPTRETASVASARGLRPSGFGTPVARPVAVLDGTYRFDYDYEQANDQRRPIRHTHQRDHLLVGVSLIVHIRGMRRHHDRLDNNNHQVARSPAQSAEYRFVDGHWQSAPVQRQLSQPRCLGADGQVVKGTNSVVLTWSFEPQPDGTLPARRPAPRSPTNAACKDRLPWPRSWRLASATCRPASPSRIRRQPLSPRRPAPQPHRSRAPSSTAPTGWTSICRIRRSTAQ